MTNTTTGNMDPVMTTAISTSDNNNHFQSVGLESSMQKIVNNNQKKNTTTTMVASSNVDDKSHLTRNNDHHQELKQQQQPRAKSATDRSSGQECLESNGGELNCIGQSIFYDYVSETPRTDNLKDIKDIKDNGKGLLNQHHPDNATAAVEDTTNGNSSTGANVSDATLKENNNFNNLVARNYNDEEEEGKQIEYLSILNI